MIKELMLVIICILYLQRKITYDDIEEPGITAKEKSHRSWLFYLGKDSSIITDLFLGQFRSTLKCSECDHESVTFEPFWLVSLPLSKECVDLHQCMELFVKGGFQLLDLIITELKSHMTC